MAWIESHETLPNHPKTKRLCRQLKIDKVYAVGLLHFFWWWAMNHAQDGDLNRYTADDIADACEWNGDSQEFFKALVMAEFIDDTPDGYMIHDWYDYAGKLIALRQKDAERKRNSRGKKDESAGHPVDIQRTSGGSLAESIRNPNPNLNQDLNKEINTTATTMNPFRFFESEGFGTISSVISDKLGDMVDTYGERWVIEAMREAVVHGVRKLSYVDGILKRYQSSGIDEPWTAEKPKPAKVYNHTNRNGGQKVKMPVYKAPPAPPLTPDLIEVKQQMLSGQLELPKAAGFGDYDDRPF